MRMTNRDSGTVATGQFDSAEFQTGRRIRLVLRVMSRNTALDHFHTRTDAARIARLLPIVMLSVPDCNVQRLHNFCTTGWKLPLPMVIKPDGIRHVVYRSSRIMRSIRRCSYIWSQRILLQRLFV